MASCFLADGGTKCCDFVMLAYIRPCAAQVRMSPPDYIPECIRGLYVWKCIIQVEVCWLSKNELQLLEVYQWTTIMTDNVPNSGHKNI